MTDTIRAALEQAVNNALLCSSFHNAASRAKQAAMTARAALSQPELAVVRGQNSEAFTYLVMPVQVRATA